MTPYRLTACRRTASTSKPGAPARYFYCAIARRQVSSAHRRDLSTLSIITIIAYIADANMQIISQVPIAVLSISLGGLFPLAQAAISFDKCLDGIRKGPAIDGVTDNHGHPMQPFPTCASETPFCNATALTYDLCIDRCGHGPVPFSWGPFSQQFGAWLLPWLALVSQLPFGSRYRPDDVMAMLLTVGSPALAAYTLVLNVLNARWIARRLAGARYPNARLAARALNHLQQAALKVDATGGRLAALVVLHHNDGWWEELARLLEYKRTWSMVAVANVLWVVAAFVLTIVNAFSAIEWKANSEGQAVGALWLWLLPVTVGWMQISPRCEYPRLRDAMRKANRRAYVATEDGTVVAADALSERRGISFHEDGSRDTLFDDEQCTAPIFSYARVFSWARAAEDVASAFTAASENATRRIPVSSDRTWTSASDKGHGKLAATVHPDNREGRVDEVATYCSSVKAGDPRGNTVWTRIAVASLASLGLQWATTGAALMIVMGAPTVGFSCRSGTYLMYGVMSTVVWICMVLSSILADHALPRPVSANRMAEMGPSASTVVFSPPQWLLTQLSLALRRAGKTLAIMNSGWVVITCVMQFSNLFRSCYCSGCVLSLGKRFAYVVMSLNPEDIPALKRAWIGGIALSTVSTGAFMFFLYLCMDSDN
ncbi:hypothetical protein BD626DRAFT_100727 [Schizophyllum amplum]|uniref:Uncharacterized protein n=1 Tax=Schizophyllum amplum TaxID=97359 RepID=A0A550CRK4_9AGAR|nr:hypothetical protein BD626DRAFT_100727 [Auriculariopsis ampla]